MLEITDIDKLLENVKDINEFAYNIIKKNYSISIKEHDYIFNSNKNKFSVPRLSQSYPTFYKKQAEEIVNAILKENYGIEKETLSFNMQMNSIINKLPDELSHAKLNDSFFLMRKENYLLEVYMEEEGQNFIINSFIFDGPKKINVKDKIHKCRHDEIKSLVNSYLTLVNNENDVVKKLLTVSEFIEIKDLNLNYIKRNSEKAIVLETKEKGNKTQSTNIYFILQNQDYHKLILYSESLEGVEVNLDELNESEVKEVVLNAVKQSKLNKLA